MSLSKIFVFILHIHANVLANVHLSQVYDVNEHVNVHKLDILKGLSHRTSNHCFFFYQTLLVP